MVVQASALFRSLSLVRIVGFFIGAQRCATLEANLFL